MKLFLMLLFSVSASADLIVPPAPSATPAPITTAQLQAMTKGSVKFLVNKEFRVLKASVQSLVGFIWSNSMGLTPDQAVAGLGTDCGQFRKIVAGLVKTMNDARAGTIVISDPRSVTVNADGTCTIAP